MAVNPVGEEKSSSNSRGTQEFTEIFPNSRGTQDVGSADEEAGGHTAVPASANTTDVTNINLDENPVMVCKSTGRALIYPQHLLKRLKLTAPLPFATTIVGLCTSFYGIAILSFILGISSICYWWWPYTDNPWKKIDMCCVGLCIVYCYAMGVDFDGIPQTIWFAFISVLVVTVITNETIMYVMLPKADLKEKVQIWKRNLVTHSFCAHIMINALISTFLLIYRFVLDQPAIAAPSVMTNIVV